MILFTISGVVPYNKIKKQSLQEVHENILQQIKKSHPHCEQLNNPFCSEDIILTFEPDGVYYEYPIEA